MKPSNTTDLGIMGMPPEIVIWTRKKHVEYHFRGHPSGTIPVSTGVISFQTWNWVDGSWDLIRMIFAHPCHRCMNQGVPRLALLPTWVWRWATWILLLFWGCSSSKLIDLYSHSCGGYIPNLGWIVHFFIVFFFWGGFVYYMEITITSDRKKYYQWLTIVYIPTLWWSLSN